MIHAPHSVLVTGSSGFIGSHVMCHLHAVGHRVTSIDILRPKSPLPDGVEFRQCDIRQRLLPNKAFDAVVHLATLAGVHPSNSATQQIKATIPIGSSPGIFVRLRVVHP